MRGQIESTVVSLTFYLINMQFGVAISHIPLMKIQMYIGEFYFPLMKMQSAMVNFTFLHKTKSTVVKMILIS